MLSFCLCCSVANCFHRREWTNRQQFNDKFQNCFAFIVIFLLWKQFVKEEIWRKGNKYSQCFSLCYNFFFVLLSSIVFTQQHEQMGNSLMTNFKIVLYFLSFFVCENNLWKKKFDKRAKFIVNALICATIFFVLLSSIVLT